ncbi:hypothetical protein V6N11_009111 [Hibiscus sabdariffa]|uniref:Protein kinase domain-containing protein n=1 Tax=Hibiscus sabdariffa TaxID=183260 RepID=A0ABR2PQ72_9ROSI
MTVNSADDKAGCKANVGPNFETLLLLESVDDWGLDEKSHLSARSDVYSFGVVLLEILSGRRAIDKNRPSGEQKLVEWAKPYLANKRKVLRVLDNRLEGQYSMEGALKASTLALRCLSIDSRFRPSMIEVVTALQQLLDSNDSGSNQNNTNSRRRQSADVANGGRSATAYPRPSASPLFA